MDEAIRKKIMDSLGSAEMFRSSEAFQRQDKKLSDLYAQESKAKEKPANPLFSKKIRDW